VLPTLYDEATTGMVSFATEAQANVTESTGAIRSRILGTIDEQEEIILEAFNCQPMATNAYVLRQGLCGDTIASFDAFWSTLVIMSLWSFLSLPITVFVANTLFLDLRKFQPGDAEFQ
jgi:hypothetical protein